MNRCQRLCNIARGPGYLEREDLSVHHAATSYFLALTGLHTSRWRQARLYFGESLTIIQTLGLHKPSEQVYTPLGKLPASLGSQDVDHVGDQAHVVDNITLETGRRVFWTLFTSIRNMQQLGADFPELVITPPTGSSPYPPLPCEVDDFCIYPLQIDPQPPGYLPLIAGFNANVRTYCSYDSLATMNMAGAPTELSTGIDEKQLLHDCLQRCKDSASRLPSELSVGPNFSQPAMIRDSALSLTNTSQQNDEREAPEQRNGCKARFKQ